MKISLPQNIIAIISKINNCGYEAFLVGGCVRDLIMERNPNDWDIATNASTNAIKAIFTRTYNTGLKHGTVTAIYNGIKAEITTYRKEAMYSDHRRPDFVIFTDTLTDDLSRRDFTVNSMAYHPEKGLTDPFNGLDDIKEGVIRCVGNPEKRFSEDALRMLRAIRFSAQLGFKIEDKTFSAIKKYWSDLYYVSVERIQSELNKILVSKEPQKLYLLWKSGLSQVIFPDIKELNDEWINYAKYFSDHGNKKTILLSLLFLSAFKDMAKYYYKKLLKKLKYDNKTIRSVGLLISCIEDLIIFSDRNLRKAVTEYGEEVAKNTIEIKTVCSKFTNAYRSFIIDRIGKDIVPLKADISGLDLINAGLCSGPGIKEMLLILMHCIYEKTEVNNFDILMSIAKSVAKSQISISDKP
ncbi:MAG: CCA tRNA nucleotidyltransferase [Clostridiaceae bacterium]|nr:CCA tRNA nucleotidyltransferase [Clostridiaceae bacterium]